MHLLLLHYLLHFLGNVAIHMDPTRQILVISYFEIPLNSNQKILKLALDHLEK